MEIRAGIASTTHLDLHGQRAAVEFLRRSAEGMKDTYVPLLIDHDWNQLAGVILNARVVPLEDGEHALLAVNGMFENEAEHAAFRAGDPNTSWHNYELIIDDLENQMSEIFNPTNEPDPDGESPEYPNTLAGRLERYLDTTSVTPDGEVYLVKFKIVQLRDLEVHVHSDHPPPHFHILSTQRNMNARVLVETLELHNMAHGDIKPRDLRKVQSYFRNNGEEWDRLKREHTRMQGAG